MSFYSIKQVQSARKKCRCYWCGESVNIGEPKTATATVWEGDFHSDSFHPECHDALKAWQNLPANKHEDEWPEQWSMQRGSTLEKGEQP